MGTAFLTIFLQVPGLSSSLYTLFPLALVLIVQGLPLGSQMMSASVNQISPQLEEASAMSGAGHDAQEISAICPTAIVFVAGEYGGISHTPREYSNPQACANGIDVLANAVLRLADQP